MKEIKDKTLEEIVKEIGFDMIYEKNLNKYNGKPGVWIMFGKQKNSDKYICLNVGKTVDVGKELKTDYDRIKKFVEYKEKIYKNQFNEELFRYKEYASHLDFLYKNIEENYEDIKCVCIYDTNDKNIEKYTALSLHALFWKNGRSFGEKNNKKLSNSDIQELINDIKINDYSFKKNITILNEWCNGREKLLK